MNFEHDVEDARIWGEIHADTSVEMIDGGGNVNNNGVGTSYTSLNICSANLDQFYRNLYTYYKENGIACIIVNAVTELIILLYVACLSTSFFLVFDWSELLSCDETTCTHLTSYIHFEPGLWWGMGRPGVIGR